MNKYEQKLSEETKIVDELVMTYLSKWILTLIPRSSIKTSQHFDLTNLKYFKLISNTTNVTKKTNIYFIFFCLFLLSFLFQILVIKITGRRKKIIKTLDSILS